MKVLIKNIREFAYHCSQVGVHQVLKDYQDIDNAYRAAERNGFETIVFYVKYPKNWMANTDFRKLINAAKTGECA